jgi:hypothetical protein
MKTLILPSFFLILIYSCSEDTSSNVVKNEVNTETKENTVSTIDSVINESSFLEEFLLYRKELLSNGDYSVSTETLIQKDGFEFYFIKERLDDQEYNYCISINGDVQHLPYAEEIDYFLDIQTYLNGKFDDYQLFIGSPTFKGDVNKDQNIDYFITNSWNHRTNSGGNGQVLTYDGEKGLNLSSFSSNSDFESGICEHIIGFKEELTHSNNHPFEITIKRIEVKSDQNTCELEYELSYEKKFKWKGNKWTNEPTINTDFSGSNINEIPKRFTYLIKVNGVYVVEEDCQNGGNMEIGLKEYEPTEGAKYFILDESDNVETFFLAGIHFIDNENFNLLWRPMGEYASGGDFESLENSGILRIMKVRKDQESDNIYFINGEPYTISADDYEYIPCEEH